ncbi:MAG: flagellar biosynthesis protein FlhA, partial [Oscillospiraceae bacterium]
LGLNISSTRLILTKGGDAGNVIEAFGSFVLSGNVVVGFIIFIIIVLVQFIVITKGSERVAEVSARFTLDAMPGKQMAIDADLNSGLIDEKQARTRRENIQREAEFYGSMDGATKFVKGDAIMSIIITAINFIGGVIIGAVQGGMPFGEVLNLYSIATVGDGLVSQIPALLISTATGMIVTRSASKDNLSVEITKQFFAQPIVMIIAGVAIAVLGMLPKMPHFQFLLLASVLLFFGIRAAKTQESLIKQQNLALASPPPSGENGDEEIPDEAEYYKNIDNVYNLLQIDAIEMEFGYSLLPLVDERAGSSFIERLVMFRRQFALEMGAVVPEVRLRDNGYLSPNQYVIKIKGEEVSKGEILVDYYLALNPGNLSGEIDGIETIEPAYGIPSKWITADQKELAEIYGYTVIDPLSVIITHLSETVKRYAN